MSKLRTKHLDMIAANRVGVDLGFDREENELSVFWSEGSIELGRASKEKLARQLVRVIAEQYNEKNTTQAH